MYNKRPTFIVVQHIMSYQMDRFADLPIRIRLFWRNYKKWQNNLPDNSDDLISCPETILHDVEIISILFQNQGSPKNANLINFE